MIICNIQGNPWAITILCNKEEESMKKTIVKLLVVLATILLPLIFTVPKIDFTLKSIVPLVAGVLVFCVITQILADERWRKFLLIIPAIIIVGIVVSFIPLKIPLSYLIGYYACVILAIALSLVTQILHRVFNSTKKYNDDEDDDY